VAIIALWQWLIILQHSSEPHLDAGIRGMPGPAILVTTQV